MKHTHRTLGRHGGRPFQKILALAVFATLSLGGCDRHREAQAPAPELLPTRTVRTAPVAPLVAQRTAPALVRARETATLSSRFAASVVSLAKSEGERVSRGEVLVRLDATALDSALAAAQAAAATAEADLARFEALAAQGAATRRELEDVRARAAAAGARIAAERDGLAYAVLRAPFSGVIARRHVDVGDVVQPGQPMLELEGDVLELAATLEHAELGLLALGGEVAADIDGQPAPLTATVRAVSPAGDPTTHRFELRATLPSAPGLRSGLFARLRLPEAAGEQTEPALAVPAEALFTRGGLTGLFVAEGGVASLRWVARGAEQGQEVEIRAGVAAGEKVVLTPGDLRDGQPIVEGGTP